MKKYYLIGDIGGTHLNLGLLLVEGERSLIVHKKTLLTKDYHDFSDALNKFNTEIVNYHKILIEKAIFAVAGKVNEISVKTPNIMFKIDKNDIIKKTTLKDIEFINDFTAISYSISNISKDKLEIINSPKKEISSSEDKKIKLVIGAGTGLGKSVLIENKSFKYVIESEAGHTDFCPQNQEELELSEFIKKITKTKNVEYEDLVSGRGLENIYHFLSKKKLSAEEISKLKSKDKNAKKAFKMFYLFYARFAKNCAIDSLASEVYLGGGIITKNLNFSKTEFLKEFTNNKTYLNYLKEIPIYIIKDYETSLSGIGQYVLNR